jgi:hypothetical protein
VSQTAPISALDLAALGTSNVLPTDSTATTHPWDRSAAQMEVRIITLKKFVNYADSSFLDHCLAGNVCVDGGSGCCPIGTAISACGAQSTLATIAPPAASSSTSSAAASSSTTSLVVVQTPYANTTFTKPSKSSAATSQEIPVSTAYSTTTIPLAGGGVTTSTALTLVYPTPTMTSSSGPVVINNGGVGLAVPGMIYGMGWLVMIVTLGAML